jgi:hypothetical protein
MTDLIQTSTSTTSFTMNALTGFARFESASHVLVRARLGAQWELYTVTLKGRSKGLEMFSRYLTPSEFDKAHVAALWECGRARLPELQSHAEALFALVAA